MSSRNCVYDFQVWPGGKVMLNGKTYEAKSIDVYIDPHREVEVIGFDNFTVVVKPLSRSAEEEA